MRLSFIVTNLLQRQLLYCVLLEHLLAIFLTLKTITDRRENISY